MCSGMVLVSPRMCPDTTDTAPNSPMARALQSTTPYTRPQRIFGSVTWKKVIQPPAPSVMAASSSSLPSCCMSGISSRATYGKVTNMVASMMPGSAKMMLRSCSRSHTPNQPCRPNSSTKIMPEITGEIASGRSISGMRMLLPRNSNLALDVAAAPPRLQQVDGEQHDEGDAEHHHPQGRGAVVVELLEMDDDEERGDLGLHRQVAGDENDRAVLPEGARERQREAGQERGQHRRQDDAAEDVDTARTQGLRRLLQITLHLQQRRLHGAHRERHADQGQREGHAHPGVRDFHAPGLQVAPDPAVVRKHRGERDT